MVLTEKKYAEDEYEGLVMELLQSPDIDAELQYHPQSILNSNPNFYLLMFRAVEKIKDAATKSNDVSLLAALNPFEAKLYEYTNVIPADLPDSILRDRNLVGYYLTDHHKAVIEKDWQEFQTQIKRKTNEIPKEIELPFLEWCDKMLKMNLERHNKKCKDPGNCGINQGYDRRLLFISKLIGEAAQLRPAQRTLPQPAPIMLPQTSPIIIPTASNETMKKVSNKIKWLGTQRQLAELFAVLKMKGWIEKFEYDIIKECFTESDSIQQYLKPGKNKETGEDTYPEIFKTNYDERFYGIKKKSGK